MLFGAVLAVAAWRFLSGDALPPEALRSSPPVSEAAPAAGTEERTGIPPAAPEPEPETELAPAPPRFTVQVASFRTRRRAQSTLALASGSTGLPGTVVATEVGGVTWQRILLGAFATEAEARAAMEPLLEQGFFTEVVVRPLRESWLPALTGRVEEPENP
jgi:cell division protein FtsN